MSDEWVVDDITGQSWLKCKPDCALEVVRPGQVQCDCMYGEDGWVGRWDSPEVPEEGAAESGPGSMDFV